MPPPLSTIYPFNAPLTLTLPSSPPTKLTGVIYATDDISNTITIKLTDSNDSSETQSNANANANATCDLLTITGNWKQNGIVIEWIKRSKEEELNEDGEENKIQMVKIKTLQDREKHALKLSLDRLSHLNPSASPYAHVIFERLIKACGVVKWSNNNEKSKGSGGGKGTDIVVLDEVLVCGPGYGVGDCRLINKGNNGGSNSGNGASGSGSGGSSSNSTSANGYKKLNLTSNTNNTSTPANNTSLSASKPFGTESQETLEMDSLERVKKIVGAK